MFRKTPVDERIVDCDLGCGQKVEARSLAFHKRDQCGMRTHQCGPCGKVMRSKDEQAHDAECPEMFVPCKWCGAIRIARRDIETHTTTCADYPTYCRYALHGCTAKVVRRELPSHHQESAQRHLSLLTEALEDIQDSVGGSGRMGSLASSDQASGELPLALWPKVQAAMTKEMTGTGHMEQRSYEERIATLEAELRTKKTEEPKNATDSKHAENIAKLETQNKELIAKLKTLSGQVAELRETSESRDRESRVAKEALDKHHAEDVAKFTKDNKKLSDTVATLTGQMEALVKNNESVDRKMKGMVEYGLPPTHSMDPTDDIVEDKCYRLPIYWSCKLEKGVTKRSPLFYLPDGYRLKLGAGWYTGESTFVVGASLVKGEHDGRDGMWPWCGEMELEVKGEGGVVLGEKGVAPVGDTGRTRPIDDVRGNGCFLIWKDLPLDKDQTSISIILSKT